MDRLDVRGFDASAAESFSRVLGCQDSEIRGTRIVDFDVDADLDLKEVDSRPIGSVSGVHGAPFWGSYVEGFDWGLKSGEAGRLVVGALSGMDASMMSCELAHVPVLVGLIVGYVMLPQRPFTVSRDMLIGSEFNPAWTHLTDPRSDKALEFLPLESHFTRCLVGEWLLIKDQFERWYPPALIVHQHPNNLVLGAIFFETIAPLSPPIPTTPTTPQTTSVDNRADRGSDGGGVGEEGWSGVELGVDAFPTRDPQDYETYDAYGDDTQPNVSTDAGRGQEILGGGAAFEVHYISNPWFRRQLYSSPHPMHDGPSQFLFIPKTPTNTRRRRRHHSGQEKQAQVKQADSGGVRFLAREESNRRSMASPTFRRLPMSARMVLDPVSIFTKRPLTHSWPLPYYALTRTELALADRLWDNHRFPTVAPTTTTNNATTTKSVTPDATGASVAGPDAAMLMPECMVRRSEAVRALLCTPPMNPDF